MSEQDDISKKNFNRAKGKVVRHAVIGMIKQVGLNVTIIGV